MMIVIIIIIIIIIIMTTIAMKMRFVRIEMMVVIAPFS